MPCKIEPTQWLVSNLMYHSLQCIILKHISRLFSRQLLTDKKILPVTDNWIACKKSFSMTLKITATLSKLMNTSFWAVWWQHFLPLLIGTLFLLLASSLHRTWQYQGPNTKHHSEQGGKGIKTQMILHTPPSLVLGVKHSLLLATLTTWKTLSPITPG